MADNIVKMRQTLASDVDWTAINGTVEDLVDSGHDITIRPQQVISKGSPLNVKAYGAVGDGTTDDYTAIQAAITEACTYADGADSSIVFPKGIYSISQPLVIPEPPDNNDFTRLNLHMYGRGHAIIRTAGIFNALETYDVTVIEPAKWTKGLTIENLEFDGNGVGTNGLRLHGVAQNLRLINITSRRFTNAQMYLSRCLETTIISPMLIGDVGAGGYKYGIYTVDGTTHQILGGTIFFVECGYHVDGNSQENDAAGDANNDGTTDIYMAGTVIEAVNTYGIHLSAGDKMLFDKVHIESVGRWATGGVCVKVDDNGGEDPRWVDFNRCTFTTYNSYANGDRCFDLADCINISFTHCTDNGLKGGTVASTALYTAFTAGWGTNDFRPWSASNITNNAVGTLFYEDSRDNGFTFRGNYYNGDANSDGTNSYTSIQPRYGYPIVTRDAAGRSAFAIRVTGDSNERLLINASGNQRWGSGSAAYNTELGWEDPGGLLCDPGVGNFVVTDTSSSNATAINCLDGWNRYQILAENTTIGEPTNKWAGAELHFVFKQESGNSYTVAWDARFVLEGGAFTMTGGKGYDCYDTIRFQWNQTAGKWIEVSRSQDIQ